ncbi:MAG: glycosyltransferase family 4 protein, partial [Gammaproteobacteria bacterium]
GSIFRSGDLSYLKKLFFWVYRKFIIKADCIFFQNRDDLKSFKNLNFIGENQQTLIVPGSGVNLKYFSFSDLPNINKLSFLMISRLLIDKGVIEYLDAAKHFINSYPRITFHLLGWGEENANSISRKDFKEINEQKNINLIDTVDDVRPVIRSSHVLVHPSYHEGMPRSVLESMSMGRPIITTNAPGCRDSIIDGYNGYLVNARDSQSLIKAIAKIISSPSKLKNMSHNSRKLAEQKFDVRIVNKLIIDKIINLI